MFMRHKIKIILSLVFLGVVAWFAGFISFSERVFAYLPDKGEEVTAEDYVKQLFMNHDADFVTYKNYEKKTKEDVRLIALYLPQYHQFDENNRWHGKGFTEWTNVTKALPLFPGHYQPKLPIDVGFYDLTHDDVMKRQIELAKNYGISGFAFYYYWFSGKKLMEKPVYNYLHNPELDFPFSITWANENWSKRWDGGNREVLMEQHFTVEDFPKLAADLLEFFKDSRYIRINGRPLFTVYRPALFDRELFVAFTEYLREFCKNEGVGEPYIVGTRAFAFWEDPALWGLDAVMEFEFNNLSGYRHLPKDNIDKRHMYTRFDHADYINKGLEKFNHPYKTFRTVFPRWDNSPRKAYTGAYIFDGTTPEIYGKWLSFAVNDTQKKMTRDERIVFINAWNEWGEGAVLEPDRRYGYAYLDVTRAVMDGRFKEDNDKIKKTGIAVLTGGRYRITKGVSLLQQGKGERLLISGVMDEVKLEDIAKREDVRFFDGSEKKVDLGYKARTTVGNAEEIKEWAAKNGFKNIVVVTSFYHIPRSRVELKRVMPDIDFTFEPVNSGFILKTWWRHWGSFKFLAAEYCKYLAVKLQYMFE